MHELLVMKREGFVGVAPSSADNHREKSVSSLDCWRGPPSNHPLIATQALESTNQEIRLASYFPLCHYCTFCW